MKKIQFSGVLNVEIDDWTIIKLIQPDGLKIDLVTRFKEVEESFPNAKFQVNYWISDKPCSRNEMVEGWLKKLHGDISAEYSKEDYYYSEWTNGSYFHTTIQIGSHDISDELIDHAFKGRFIIIEINIFSKP